MPASSTESAGDQGAERKRARYDALIVDLEAEIDELDGLLGRLAVDDWRLDTQSRGWTVAHQIGHLELTERLMHIAMTDEATFRQRAPLSRTKADIPPERLASDDLAAWQWQRWRESRRLLLDDLRSAPWDARMPWVGPSMSVSSAATARVMEIWAHGEDIYTAVGARRAPTARLRHIAHLAVAARDFSFRNRGLEPPAEPFRVEIAGPSGALWTWGPEDAPQRVTADAYDFALLATRRIHRVDARVVAIGRDAYRWLRTIQAYAGPPGPRRRPQGSDAISARLPLGGEYRP